MPDLHRLQDFLGRTQFHLNKALKDGNRPAVDQYEQFLDRADQVAQKAFAQQQAGGSLSDIGQQGPQGEQGAPGLTGGDEPQFTPGSTLVGGNGLANDFKQETQNPFSGLGQPNQSPIQQMTNGVPKAPQKPYVGPAEGMPQVAPNKSGGVLDWVQSHASQIANPISSGLDAMQSKVPLAPWLDNAVSMARHPLDTAANAAKGIAQSTTVFPGGAMMGRMGDARPPQALNAPPRANSGIQDYEAPNPPSDKISLDDAISRTKNMPDIQAELAKMKASLGDKPTFFTLENLAMLLLIGAPKAYTHFKGEVGDWEKNRRHIDEMGLQYQFGKVGDKAKADHYRDQAALEREKAGGTLLPHIVSAKQRPIEDKMKEYSAEIRTIMNNPATDMTKVGDPNVARVTALRAQIEELAAESADIANQAYNKKK